MTKKKAAEFAPMVRNMDPAVAKNALEQFPKHGQLCLEMVKVYKGIVDKILAADAKNSKAFYDACNSILE